ncbi:MAG: hypothetical protein GY765_43135 [bacterium]|nr:hypothetical protein [bacterium]
MNQFKVNRAKCRGCGVCETNCCRNRFEMKAGKAVYKGDEGICISCFHCMARCPENAVEYTRPNPLTTGNRKDGASPALLRRSCRSYKKSKVDKSLLTEIITGANLAPRSSIDYEERQFIVIRDENKIRTLRSLVLNQIDKYRKLFGFLQNIPLLPKSKKKHFRTFNQLFTKIVNDNKKSDNLFKNAPALVLVTGPKKHILSPDNSLYAMSQLMVLAEEKGLGTCVIGTLSAFSKIVEAYLGLDSNYKVFAGVVIGNPEKRFDRYVGRNDPTIHWH